jgi:hypothetical protein
MMMKKKTPVASVARGAGIALGLGLVVAGPLTGDTPPRYDIPYSMEVETPHVTWARSLPGGPIRGFFIPSVSRGRDMVELMERLSLEPRTVTIDRAWDVNCWGIGDDYGHEYRGDRDDFRTVLSYVEQDLTGPSPFEVMLIPGLNGWSRLTRPTRDAILRRVREGAGLVLLHPFVGDVEGHPFKGDEAEGDTRIWDVSPLVGVPDDLVSDRGYAVVNEAAVTRGRWEKTAGRHFITDGVALDLLPEGLQGGRLYTYEARGDVLVEAAGHPLLATRTYGRGRVVAFGYVEDGFLPEAVDAVESGTYWPYWEYQYALLARALLWAAHREGDLGIETLTASAESGLEIVLTTPAPRKVEIEVTGRSAFGPPLRPVRLDRALAAGRNVIPVATEALRPEGGFSGGRQLLDVIVKDEKGATLNWGSATFETPRPATVTSVKTATDVYRRGDLMSLVARAAGHLEGLRLRVEVRDDVDRLVFREEKKTRGETYFFFDLAGFRGQRARVRAELLDERGRILDQRRAKPVLVVQRERRSADYRALLSFEDTPARFAALRKSREHALAIDPGFTWGGDVNNDLDLPRGTFGVYWYDRGPTTPEGLERAIAEFEKTGDVDSLAYLTKLELYKRTGDTRFLVRKPSFHDPDVERRLRDIPRRVAGNKALYNFDYFFVGDEGSLSAYTDPVDFDWSAPALARFREWLRERYGSLEALNREWGSAFTDWDSVRPSTTEEARRSGRFAPWADHRTYMEVSFARAYRTVREGVREGDPEGHVALSGTQVTTPWNGCDWYRLDQIIDDFLSYSGGNQWDLHRSFAKPGAEVGFWTGYGRSGVGVQHEIWAAALTGVLHPNVFWSYSVVNPDFTWSKSGRDMGEVFSALRFEGIGRLLSKARRESDGVLLHYSMPSVHAAGILGFHPGRREEAAASLPADRDGWASVLRDLGLSFDFRASPQIERDGLDADRDRVFILPLSLALSGKEAAALRRFAEAGGAVVADGGTGLLNEHASWRQTGVLDDLFGIGAGSPAQRNLKARAAGPVSVTTEGGTWGLQAQELAGLEALEAGVHAAGASPLLKMGDADAVFVRRVGRGWAVYLNLLLDRYSRTRRRGYGGGAERALLRRLLAHVGVEPPIGVLTPTGTPVERAYVTRHRFGKSEVVSVLLEPSDVTAREGVDGVTTYEDARLGPVARHEIVVRLPRTTHVANARTGETYGITDTVRVWLREGDALVLGLDDSPGGVTLEGPAEARRGDRLSFAVTASGPGERLVRCHVVGPHGAFLPEYARNLVLEKGAGTFLLPSALSDPAGAYRLAATDVVTGAHAEATVDLR